MTKVKEKKSFNFKEWFKKEVKDTKVLFRSIPGLVLTLFILSTVLMNILAGVPLIEAADTKGWLSLDMGILVSFLGFLLSDMIVKRFGPKAAIKTTILAMVVNLGVCAIFALVAVVAKPLGKEFPLSGYAEGPQWWIIGASSIAFLLSGVLDSLLHAAIQKLFKKNPNGKAAHIASAWGSTFVGQFFDNMIFGFLFTFPASVVGLWGMTSQTALSITMMALTGAVLELVFQAVFTPIGFRIAEKWRKENIGEEYLALHPEVTKNTKTTELNA